MTNNRPSPVGIMRLINGYWATGVLAAAATHSLFTHLEHGAGSATELAGRAGISERGAQTLLDGLVSVGLVELHEGRYRNTPRRPPTWWRTPPSRWPPSPSSS